MVSDVEDPGCGEVVTSQQVGNNNVLTDPYIDMECEQNFPATRTEIDHGEDPFCGEVVTSPEGGNDIYNVLTNTKQKKCHFQLISILIQQQVSWRDNIVN